MTPIPMRLPCPDCGELHIDEGEFATKPHHTHACQQCGNVWRPAIVETVGVRFLPGFKDKPGMPLPEDPYPNCGRCKAKLSNPKSGACPYCGVRWDHEAEVRALAEQIKGGDGVIPGVLTIGILDKERYVVDGQHRCEPATDAEPERAHARTRITAEIRAGLSQHQGLLFDRCEWVQCDTCAAKSGSPILCGGCRANRWLFSELNRINKEMLAKRLSPTLSALYVTLYGATHALIRAWDAGRGVMLDNHISSCRDAIIDIDGTPR